MKRTALLVAGVVVAAIAAGVAWFGPWHDRSGGDGTAAGRPGAGATTAPPSQTNQAEAVARRFAAAWQAGDLSKVPYTKGGAKAPALTKFAVAALTPADDDHPTKVEIVKVVPTPDAPSSSGTGATNPSAGRAVAAARVTWQLDAIHTWSYDTLIDLQRGSGTGRDKRWRVDWGPRVVHPALTGPGILRTRRVTAIRGDINSLDGRPLVGQRDVVEVGIQPSRAPDPAATARQVALITKVNPDDLVVRVVAAKPDQFVSAVTLRRDAYDAIRAQIQRLPGTVFRESKQSLAPSKDFARALLGTAGQATQEDIDASKGRVVVGDVVGRSGLQAAQDQVLGGTHGVTVEVVPPAPAAPKTVKKFPPVPGKAVTVTLDPRVQIIADAVMASAPKPAALVAIRVSTGDVLAVANGPTGFNGYDRAMIGHYPPGSTFKVASGFALFDKGVTLDTPVDCPATITIGKVFKNAGGEVLGTVPFRKDFAESCNTAFAGQSRTISGQELSDAAAKLGYRKIDLGVPLFGGSVPVTTDATEHAANMIGQGKVEASPFAVALVSASVAAGHSVTPRLIVDPTKPVVPPGPAAALAPGSVAQLREAMRLVVTDGTGTALRGVPGGDVAGKTGTAEFGTASPPQTHAWFTGFQGDVAFAVLVEDGGVGGAVAAPLAADFLTKLAGG
ncbi:MAG: penicillin-binding transpeptidase domain-containing protein [Acidimicrobiales bacterium]